MTKFYHYLWAEKLSPISRSKLELDMLDGRLAVSDKARGIGRPQPANVEPTQVATRVHPRFWAAWTIGRTDGWRSQRHVDRSETRLTRSNILILPSHFRGWPVHRLVCLINGGSSR